MASPERGEDDAAVAAVAASKSDDSQPVLPSYLEVICKDNGKIWRFSEGTESRFAIHVINGKLDADSPSVLYIESVKEGEEPIVFGPNAVLVNYGKGWSLETVMVKGIEQRRRSQVRQRKRSVEMKESDIQPSTDSNKMSICSTMHYFGKILLVFIMMFSLAAIFVLFLENLPQLIQFFSDLF